MFTKARILKVLLVIEISFAFTFLATGDTQFGYFSHNRYYGGGEYFQNAEVTLKTMINELENLNYTNMFRTMIVAGDLIMDGDNEGVDKWTHWGRIIREKYHYNLIDLKGNHDDFPFEKESVSFLNGSKVGFFSGVPGGLGVIDSEGYFDKVNYRKMYIFENEKEIAVYNYVFLVIGPNFPVCFVVLQGDDSDEIEDNLIRNHEYLLRVLPKLTSKGWPVIVLKHRNLTMNERKAIEGNTVIAVIYGHFHCTPYGDFIDNNERKLTSVHQICGIGSWGHTENIWKNYIPEFNVAAALLRTYWKFEVHKRNNFYYVSAERKVARDDCVPRPPIHHWNFKSFGRHGCDTKSPFFGWVDIC